MPSQCLIPVSQLLTLRQFSCVLLRLDPQNPPHCCDSSGACVGFDIGPRSNILREASPVASLAWKAPTEDRTRTADGTPHRANKAAPIADRFRMSVWSCRSKADFERSSWDVCFTLGRRHCLPHPDVRKVPRLGSSRFLRHYCCSPPAKAAWQPALPLQLRADTTAKPTRSGQLPKSPPAVKSIDCTKTAGDGFARRMTRWSPALQIFRRY